jgi:NADPH:quinone reductase-like Zn-dependent oxidoreductase
VSEVDLVLDLIGSETQQRSLAIIKPGGRLVTTVLPQFRDEAKEKHITMEGFTAQSYRDDLEQIAGLIDNGFVNPVVSAVLNLDEAQKAEQMSMDGHVRGKIVIKVI